MDTTIVKENVNKIIEYKHRIKLIKSKTDDVKIQLRVFTQGGWNNIDYNPNHKPSMNYVICQLILDLEDKIKECEQIIKKEVNK